MKGGSIGPSLARLNRLLLEDAYPLELSRNLGGFPYESGQQRLQAIRQVLDFAVDQGYIRFNPARGVRLEQPLDEKKARAEAEIVVDTNEQVQIALNIAATCALAGHKPGYFVPHVVLMYYAAMRPYAELRRMNPRDIRLHKELIRIFSSKTLSRRIKTLPMNAVIMLRHYWDGKPLSFDGWHQFHRLVRAAQGYKVTCAAWFQVEPGTIDVAPDVPRHTGCSHGVNLFKDLWDAIREDNHGWSTFKRRYDGLFAKEETAIFCSLFPYTLDVTAEELKQAHKYLVKHDLIAAGDPLPSAPVVMHFDATPPKHELWLPKCSDDELRDKIWDVGIDAAAKELGTYPQWLGGICRAKRIPTPRGRESRERPQDAPIPPPLTTLTDGELAELIATSHGIKPAAEKLDINSERMRAYCAVRGIPVPSAHARAVFYNKRPKVKKSRKEVSRLLGQFSIDEVAAQLGVTPDHLKAYCRRRGIQPGSAPGSKSPSITLEEIKAGVLKDLEIMPHHELTPVEAMELVLSRVPDDLDQADLIELVDQTTRIKLTLEQIKLIVKHTAKGRFYLHEARIRLLGAYEFPVDLDWLHTLVKPDLGRRDDWNLIKALRCVLPKTAKGLSVDQLLKVLPWFRIHWNEKKLKKELGRLDRHNYICFYYNRVTLPGGSPIGHLQGHKEPTVGFDAIKAQAVSAYRQLASQELTNVEMMQFVFGMAPNGLWREELLDIAKTCGVDFKAHCIDSVVKNEAKGQFDCEHGRVRFVGTPKHWNTIDDLRAALPARNGAGCLRGALVLRVLQHFPDGLKVGEIWTATKLGGHNDSRDTVRRQIYKYRKKGLVRADNGQVWLVSPGKTLADQISPMDKAA